MKLPNFLIIGAAKSGTSSLYYYLEQHPRVYCSPQKEPSFFALEGQNAEFAGPGDELFSRRAVRDLSTYQALFEGVTNETAYGEASVLYLYSPSAPARVKYYIPQAKLIAILRNPVDRALSSFAHLRREGREPLASFEKALQAEDDRVEANWQHQWHYTRLGFYYSQLKRYLELFPPDQISVYTYHEFSENPVQVLQDTFRFLSVDSSFVPDTSIKHNVSGVPRSRVLHSLIVKPSVVKTVLWRPFLPLSLRRFLRQVVWQWNIVAAKPELSRETRKYLVQIYKDDILKLQDLIKVDLSNWLKMY
jgi:hypothetical protein